MKEYKDELIKKAETLITTGFPEKIVQLNELLTTKMFADRNFHDVYQVSNFNRSTASLIADGEAGRTEIQLTNFISF